MTNKFWDIAVKSALAAAIIALFVMVLQKPADVVFVDAQKLVVGYKGMQAARAQFESKASVWKANLDTLQQELQIRSKEYKEKIGTLNARERQLTEELLQTKQQQLINYEQAIQEKFQKEDQELSKKVLDEVNAYIKKFGEQKGYTIILAATQYGNIAYAEKGIDVTEEVLNGLNNEYK